MIRELRRALDHTSDIVAAVPADAYKAPTPCPEMNVKSLVNHLVAGNIMFAAVASGEPLDLTVFEKSQLGDDPVAAYRRSAELTLAAWQRPGALDENLSFGNMPGDRVIRLHLTEELVHGWDLAQATGQDAALDPELSELALDAMRQAPEEALRSNRGFGPEVAIAADAEVGDRLVAFLGRDPAAPVG
jgi:uncharacterized protein (TIGR03086 family)